VVIVGDIDGDDSMGWFGALLLALPFVVGPQVALVQYVCRAPPLEFPKAYRRALVGTLFGGLVLLFCALRAYGAKEVRTDFGSLLFLTVLGGVWLIIAVLLFPWLGLSLRDDAMERRNRAALVALLGALVGVQLTFIGANIGEGPSYWNNLFCAALGTGALLGLWLLLELAARVSASVAEERDPASGLRLAAFLVAAGLILGRAVAGDWHSEAATVHDFVRDGWPATALWLLALITERLFRPSRRMPFLSWRAYGLPPSLLYVGLAMAWLFHVGRWEGFAQ
jgi:uncharacterized membrane protein YjfL (UPF0719 family)